MNIGIGKMATICLVLTLCLAAIGVGYGHWTNTLDIQGTAQTGEMDVGFLNAVATDNEDPGEDTALTNVTLIDWDNDGDYEWMEVNLLDAYYCYVGIVNFEVHNHGSVPVKVTKVDLQPPVGGEVDIGVFGIKVGDIIDAGDHLDCILTAHIATNASGEADFWVFIDFENWVEGG